MAASGKDLDAIFSALIENSEDVGTVIQQFGGIGNLLRAGPALFRIMKTVSSHRDAAKAADVMAYAEAIRPEVADFQRKYGLRADGLVGRETWNMVTQLLAHTEDKEK